MAGWSKGRGRKVRQGDFDCGLAQAEKEKKNKQEMKRARVFIWPLFVLLVVSLFFAVEYFLFKQQKDSTAPTKSVITEVGQVKFVYDGDTLLLANGEKVRLLGIDTPEEGERCFEEAKKYLLNLVLKKEVMLKAGDQDRDKYGRLLRWVFIDGQNVNLSLLEKGLARVYYGLPRSSNFSDLVEIERQARASKTGCLWSD